MVHVIVRYGDLANDFVNSIEFCSEINRMIPWEISILAVLAGMLLLHGHFAGFLMALPLLFFLFRRYHSGELYLDNTRIYADMNQERRICEYKLAFYLIMFFVVLYLFIQFLIS